MLKKMTRNENKSSQTINERTANGLTCIIFCAISSPHCTGYFVVHDEVDEPSYPS